MPLEQPLRAVSYARGQRLVDSFDSAGRYSILDWKVKGVALYGGARLFAGFSAFAEPAGRMVVWRVRYKLHGRTNERIAGAQRPYSWVVDSREVTIRIDMGKGLVNRSMRPRAAHLS